MPNRPYQIQDAFPHLKNPERYVGTRPCTLRSGLEISFVFKFLDVHPSVKKWSSEDIVIPYYYPVDGRRHRYFVDFWMESEGQDGNLYEHLIEIKPKAQTAPPKQPKRKTRKYLADVNEYIKNQAKWQAATLFAERNNMDFKILTESDIPG